MTSLQAAAAPTARTDRPSSWVLPPLVAGAVGVGAWALWAVANPALPGPLTTAETTWQLLSSGGLVPVVARTVGLLLLGFVGSLALGVFTGLALGAWPLLDRALSPYLIGLQSLPNAVLVPLGLLLAGPSITTVVALTIVGATPSIAMGTRDSVKTIPPLLIRAGRTMGARGTTLVRTVILPAAMPGVVDSLQYGWAFAFRAVVAAEIIIGTGLGAFLRDATSAQRSDEVLAVILVVLVLGILVDRLGFAQIRARLRADRGLTGSA